MQVTRDRLVSKGNLQVTNLVSVDIRMNFLKVPKSIKILYMGSMQLNDEGNLHNPRILYTRTTTCTHHANAHKLFLPEHIQAEVTFFSVPVKPLRHALDEMINRTNEEN